MGNPKGIVLVLGLAFIAIMTSFGIGNCSDVANAPSEGPQKAPWELHNPDSTTILEMMTKFLKGKASTDEIQYMIAMGYLGKTAKVPFAGVHVAVTNKLIEFLTEHWYDKRDLENAKLITGIDYDEFGNIIAMYAVNGFGAPSVRIPIESETNHLQSVIGKWVQKYNGSSIAQKEIYRENGVLRIKYLWLSSGYSKGEYSPITVGADGAMHFTENYGTFIGKHTLIQTSPRTLTGKQLGRDGLVSNYQMEKYE